MTVEVLPKPTLAFLKLFFVGFLFVGKFLWFV